MNNKNVVAMIASAEKDPPKEPKTFVVREGTVAVCRRIFGCSLSAAVVAHALLELWLDTKKKIVRQHEGADRQFVALTGADLATLTGRDLKTLKNTDLPALRSHPAIAILKGRLKPTDGNRYMIGFDIAEIWMAYVFDNDPTTDKATVFDGKEFVTKKVDRAKLPHLFKRLYDAYVDENGEPDL